MTAHVWHDVEIDKRSTRLLAAEVMPQFSQHMLALRGAKIIGGDKYGCIRSF